MDVPANAGEHAGGVHRHPSPRDRARHHRAEAPRASISACAAGGQHWHARQRHRARPQQRAGAHHHVGRSAQAPRLFRGKPGVARGSGDKRHARRRPRQPDAVLHPRARWQPRGRRSRESGEGAQPLHRAHLRQEHPGAHRDRAGTAAAVRQSHADLPGAAQPVCQRPRRHAAWRRAHDHRRQCHAR